MKNRPVTFLFLFLVLLLSACKPPVKGEGPLVKQSREVPSFIKTELNIPARVSVIITDSTSLVVVAQANLQEYIHTKTKGETMVISTSRMLKPTKPVEIIITCPAQEALSINGSGDIHIINPYKTERLNLEINGSGDIHANVHARKIITEINGSGDLHLSGKAENHTVVVNGSGKINAEDLITEKYSIKINGSGDADIHAASKLSAKVNGSGKVRYKGQPSIDSEILGSGEVKKKE